MRAAELQGRSLLGVLSRFSLVGVCATLTYLVVANLAISSGALTPAIASVVAYAAGMVVSFFGQGRMTFLVERTTWSQALRFAFLSLAGLAISFATVELAISYFGVHPFWGTAVTCLLVPLLSFVVMKFWVFKPASSTISD